MTPVNPVSEPEGRSAGRPAGEQKTQPRSKLREEDDRAWDRTQRSRRSAWACAAP